MPPLNSAVRRHEASVPNPLRALLKELTLALGGLAISAAVLIVLWLSFRSIPFEDRASAYVVMEPKEVTPFLSDIRKITVLNGLSSNYGSVVSGGGRTTHVLEATGRALRVWISNVPLSGEEGCYDISVGGPDPGQFQIRVTPARWFPLFEERAVVLTQKLVQDLRGLGYRVLAQPAVPCSVNVLREAPSK